MSNRRQSASTALEHALRIYLASRCIAELGDDLLLAVVGKLVPRQKLAASEREILRRARQLVEVLEGATPRVGSGVVDIRGRLRRRAILKAFDNSRPPPKAA
jgi:hypothetical protein